MGGKRLFCQEIETARRRHRFRHGSAPSTGIRRRLRTWTTRTIDLERYHPCSRTGNWPVFGAQEHSPGTLQHDWEGPGSPLRSQVSTSPTSHEPMEWVKCLACTHCFSFWGPQPSKKGRGRGGTHREIKNAPPRCEVGPFVRAEHMRSMRVCGAHYCKVI